MSEKRNQHYVPRIHLKPFTLGGKGSAISLYASGVGKFIHNAPVKSQCSGPFFYGKDLSLENQLMGLEGKYGEKVVEVVSAGKERPSLNASWREWMRMFWCVQWARTDAAAKKAQEMFTGAAQYLHIPKIAEIGPDDRWVIVTLSSLHKAMDLTADLEYVLLRNKTGLKFVTSDNPAIMFNKLHALNSRVRGRSCGLGSAGAILLMPLTPEHVLCFYDADVYSITNKKRWVDVASSNDVLAINELQVLNCQANIYFSPEFEFEWIEASFRDAAKAREKPLMKLSYAVLDKRRDGVEVFRVVGSPDEEQHTRGLLVSESTPRVPRKWPSFLRWRHRGIAFDSGTGVGVVRAAFVRDNPMMKFSEIRINQ